MAEYVNQFEHIVFDKVEKHPISKQQFDSSKLPDKFFIKAYARGKEILLMHYSIDSPKEAMLTITMGMSGSFYMNEGSPSKWPMLTWISKNVRLELLDHRRFAKWSFRNFNPDRGPDVVFEHVEFKKLIRDNTKKLNKPL